MMVEISPEILYHVTFLSTSWFLYGQNLTPWYVPRYLCIVM
jgi:hypothetical protein